MERSNTYVISKKKVPYNYIRRDQQHTGAGRNTSNCFLDEFILYVFVCLCVWTSYGGGCVPRQKHYSCNIRRV